MCYAQGSVQHMTSRCSMCHLFPPQKTQCPHVPLSVCSNRVNHPRFNVVHYTTAEVPAFNGCGYCKYAAVVPFADAAAAWYNPGWPGCCRPPGPTEAKWIRAQDWAPISILHNIPIPDEIKKEIQEIEKPETTKSSAADAVAIPDRRNTGTTTRSKVIGDATAPTTIPARRSTVSQNTSRRTPPGGVTRRNSTDRRRSEDSSAASPPQQGMAALGNLATSPSRTSLSSSNPNGGSDAYRVKRDRERTEDVNQRSNPRRPSFTVSPNSGPSTALSISGAVITQSPSSMSRKTGAAANGGASATSTISGHSKKHSYSRSLEAAVAAMNMGTTPTARPVTKPPPPACPPSPETASSGTRTSDGGFTDYLSDESEAELQRQAEERVVRIELAKQTQYEENEFRQAREQLSSVGLQPPKAWNPTASGGGIPVAAGGRSVPSTISKGRR